jgi:hypothetical protein
MDNVRAFWKCIDTVNSCRTKDQLEIARKMCKLYSKKTNKNIYFDGHLVTALLMKECILSS